MVGMRKECGRGERRGRMMERKESEKVKRRLCINCGAMEILDPRLTVIPRRS